MGLKTKEENAILETSWHNQRKGVYKKFIINMWMASKCKGIYGYMHVLP